MSDPLKPDPDGWSRRVELRDGTKLLLRQIRPEDRERLAAGMSLLSPASRYLRFHEVIEELSEEQLDYLTNVDHADHEAIVAVDLDSPDVPGVGVARYIRDDHDPHVGEAAVTVADDYQGTGAGTLLLGALASRARANGISVFRNYVLDGNHTMLEVFDHLGAHRELEAEGLWRVDLDVPADESELPSSAAGRAFDEIARGDRRLASLMPPVWSRFKRLRRQRADDTDIPEGNDGEQDSAAQDTTAEDSQQADAELDDLRSELDDWLRDRDVR